MPGTGTDIASRSTPASALRVCRPSFEPPELGLHANVHERMASETITAPEVLVVLAIGRMELNSIAARDAPRNTAIVDRYGAAGRPGFGIWLLLAAAFAYASRTRSFIR